MLAGFMVREAQVPSDRKDVAPDTNISLSYAATTINDNKTKTMKQLEDTDLMPFGKHKGIPMSDVPASYLHYLWNNGMKKETKTSNVADYIARNVDALKTENKDLIWD